MAPVVISFLCHIDNAAGFLTKEVDEDKECFNLVLGMIFGACWLFMALNDPRGAPWQARAGGGREGNL